MVLRDGWGMKDKRSAAQATMSNDKQPQDSGKEWRLEKQIKHPEHRGDEESREKRSDELFHKVARD